MEKQHPIGDLMSEIVDKVREIADTNTIVGQAITAGGVTIIPISRLSVGVGSGGTEFGSKHSCDMTDLKRVFQNVLTVTCSIVQTPECFYEFLPPPWTGWWRWCPRPSTRSPTSSRSSKRRRRRRRPPSRPRINRASEAYTNGINVR